MISSMKSSQATPNPKQALSRMTKNKMIKIKVLRITPLRLFTNEDPWPIIFCSTMIRIPAMTLIKTWALEASTSATLVILKPSCCKKRQKNSRPRPGIGNRGCLKVVIDPKLILNDQGVTHAHLGIIHNLQTSPIPKTSFLVGTFFAASYSKTALVHKPLRICS